MLDTDFTCRIYNDTFIDSMHVHLGVDRGDASLNDLIVKVKKN